MAERIASVGVDLGLNTARFEAEAQRAAKRAQSFGRSMRRAMNFAAVGLAVQQLTSHTRRATQELSRISDQARLAGTSAERFQKLAFAARTVQIDAEKLADIFKDVRDRVGDFLQTGGGPLADFFENIAPKIGITAEELKGLSGPQILGRVTKAMQDAGISANEMVFHMEAIAGDAAKLIPLYADNGRELRRLGNEAERTGAIFSNEIVARGDQMEEKLQAVSQVLDRRFKTALVNLAPALRTATQGMVAFTEWLGRGVRTAQQLVLMNDENVRVFRELADKQKQLEGLPDILRKMEEAGATGTKEYQRLLVKASTLSGEITTLKRKAQAFKEQAAEIFGIPGDEGGTRPSVPGTEDDGGGVPGTPGVVPPALPRDKPDFGAQRADRFALLEEMLSTETERISEEHQRRLQLINEAERMGLESQIGFDELRLRNFEKMSDKMRAIAERREKMERMAIAAKGRQGLAVTGQLVGALETAFGESKATAIASTLINTAESIMKTYATYGWTPWGIAAASAAAAMGAAQISAIQSQTRKGGGGAPSATGGGADATRGDNVAATGAPTGGTTVHLTLEGESFGREQVLGLIDKINEAQQDGALLRIRDPRSATGVGNLI